MTSTAIIGAGAGLGAAAQQLADDGVQAQISQLIIGGRIVEGDPKKGPDVLADHLWDLHTQRDTFRVQVDSD